MFYSDVLFGWLGIISTYFAAHHFSSNTTEHGHKSKDFDDFISASGKIHAIQMPNAKIEADNLRQPYVKVSVNVSIRQHCDKR